MAAARAVACGERLVAIFADKVLFGATLARFGNGLFPRRATPHVYLVRAHVNQMTVLLNVFEHERRKNAAALHRLLKSLRIDVAPFAYLASRVHDSGAMLARGRDVAWDKDYYFHIEIAYDDVPNAWMQDIVWKAPNDAPALPTSEVPDVVIAVVSPP